LKKGKSPTKPGSYRPVALTSCVAKTMERLVANRLSHFVESKGLLTPCQAGFRRGRSTEEQLARICQDSFDELEKKEPGKAVLCTLDFSRAYDRVWKMGLYAKLLRMGVPACMVRWIRGFLTDRRGRVRWKSATSRPRVFREGLPQGSVLAPLMWLIYCNNLAETVEAATPSTGLSLFADDAAPLERGRTVEECSVRLQPALDAVVDWCKRWKVTLSPEKCSHIVFTLHHMETKGKKHAELTLDSTPLKFEEFPKFLGLKLDS
jgi:hypothetical protein